MLIYGLSVYHCGIRGNCVRWTCDNHWLLFNSFNCLLLVERIWRRLLGMMDPLGSNGVLNWPTNWLNECSRHGRKSLYLMHCLSVCGYRWYIIFSNNHLLFWALSYRRNRRCLLRFLCIRAMAELKSMIERFSLIYLGFMRLEITLIIIK